MTNNWQILHGELEESLQAAQSQLNVMSSEMDKQNALNERLENDLLSMNKHRQNGDDNPSDSGLDVLAGLDLGKKPAVRISVH